MPPLAPRPFCQMARRDYRLYGNTLQGLRPALNGALWYHSGRRRRVVLMHCRSRHHELCWMRTRRKLYAPFRIPF